MSNVVEFVLRLKDMLSGGMQRAAASAQSSFGRMNSGLGGVSSAAQRSSASAAAGINSIGSAAQQATRNVQQLQGAFDNMNSRSGGFMNTAGAMAVGGLISGGVRSALDSAKGLITDSMNAGLEGSLIKAQFETTNGAVAGDKLFTDLTKYIQDSIFGNELYQQSSMLSGFGFGANEILPELKMLGDISMGKKENMAGLALATAQVKGAGKLQGQDLMQFINAGFNPLQEIARTTGRSYAQLKDDMSEGKIGFDQVQKSLITATSAGGRFHGMLDKIGNTPFGKKAEMEGNWENVKMQFGTAMLPAFSRLLDVIKPMMDGLPVFMEKLRPYGERLFGAVGELLPSLAEFGKTIGGLVKPIFDVMTSGEFIGAFKSVVGLASTIGSVVKPVFEQLAGVVKNVLWAFTGLVDFTKGALAFMNESGIGKVLKYTNPTELVSGALGIIRSSSDKVFGDKDTTTGKGTGVESVWDAAKFKFVPMRSQFATPADTMALQQQQQGKGGVEKAMKDMTDAIVGGGTKVLHIHMAPGTVKQEFHVGSMNEAKSVGMDDFESALLKVLYGAKSALV